MSTLQELQKQLDADLKIDPSHLMSESAGNILKHSKYFHELTNHRARLKAANLELLTLMKDRYNYYAGIGTDVYMYNLDRTAVKYNLEGDKEVLTQQKANLMLQLKVEFFEKACELMVSRGFAIKNMIEIMKFENGV